jgi:hypothetical protein
MVGARIPLGASPVSPVRDLPTSLAVLRGDLQQPITGSVARSTDEPFCSPRYLNAMVVRGAEAAIVPQRFPVPVAMWKPFGSASAHSDWFGSGRVQIGSERAGLVICYEQLIIWPVLMTMGNHPTVLIAPANDYWAKGATISMFQRTAMRSWARLFGLPCLFAVNT